MAFRHGYFTGSPYTYGAYHEPSPERLALLCLLRGQRPPDLNRPFRLLELGCGQGFHLCLQAANYPDARFVGIDGQADHIAHARSLATAGGLANVRFHAADFLDLLPNPGSPQESGALGEPFDFVVAHGILGWVSPRVGEALLRLSAAALRPGGLFYVSYNSLPGWLAALPFQHAVRSFQADQGEGLPALQAARELLAAVQQAKGQLFDAQPALAGRLEAIASQESAYLLHEYNHSEWQPLYANQVIRQAEGLGFSFLGSATLAENFDGVLPEAFRALVQRQSDAAARELVRDLLTNQSFRRDVFVHGQDPLWSREALDALDSQRVLLLADDQALRQDDAFHFRLGFGEVEGNRPWFESLVQQLETGPLPLAALRSSLAEVTLPELLQNLALLIGKGFLALLPPERDPLPAQRFNRLVLERVAAGAPYRYLASPRIGNIQGFSDIDLLAAQALVQGVDEMDLPASLEASLRALDRQPMREGQPVPAEQGQAVLTTLASRFRERTLPLMRRLALLP